MPGTILLEDLHDRANEFSDWVGQLNAPAPPPPPAPAPEVAPVPEPVAPVNPVQPVLDTLGQAKDSFLNWADQLHAQDAAPTPAPAAPTPSDSLTNPLASAPTPTAPPPPVAEPPSDFLSWVNQGAKSAVETGTSAVGQLAQAAGTTAESAGDTLARVTANAPAAQTPGADPRWLTVAREQLNKPYIWGSGSGAGGRGTGDIDPATGLPRGFDCSGYVAWVLKEGLGVDLPAQTSSAYGKTTAVGADQAKPGDVVFYNMNNPDPHVQHMALYIGDGQIIQAGGTNRNVNVASVNAVGTPEFRRAAGTDAGETRAAVGSAVQSGGGSMPSVQLDTSSPEAFIRSVTPAAQWVAEKTGIPAAAMIGMAANETGYGQHAPGNNLFGIKGTGPAGSTSSPTWEVVDGVRQNITDNFRKYDSVAQSFQDFADLVTGAPRYAKAVGQSTVGGFVQALKDGGYMTDPDYVGKIQSIVNRYQPVIAQAGAGVADTLSRATQTGQDLVRQTQDTLAATQQTGARPTPTTTDQQMASFPSRSLLEDNRTSGFRAPDEILNPGGIVSSAQQWLQDRGQDFTAPANALGEFIQPTRVREGQQALAETTPEQQNDLLNQMTSGNALDVLGRSGLGGPSEGEPLGRQRREAYETTGVSKVPVLGGALGAVVEDPSALLPIGGGAKLAKTSAPDVAALATRAATAAERKGGPLADNVIEFLRSESGELDVDALAAAARQAAQKLGLKADQADEVVVRAIGAPPTPPNISPGDWLRAVRYNSMLSGPRTVEINTLSNALEVPWRFARDTGASLVRGQPGEIRAEVDGLRMGLSKGASAFRDAWMNGTTDDIATESSHLLAPRARNAVERGAAEALDFTSRTLGATDQWAQAIAQGMALGRRAGRDATKEGLSGPEWAARVDDLMRNPTTDMLTEARSVSRRMVYQNDMGAFGNALKGVQDTPAGNVVLPFLKTVYNITSRGIDRSPLGLVATGKDVAQGKYGRSRQELAEALGSATGPGGGAAPLGERLGDAMMGTAATAAFYQQALAGNVTGEGPDDAEKRDMLRAQGWQPFSLKIGDKYVSYANWGPMAIPLSMAAAAAEAQTYRKRKDAEVGDMLLDASKRTAGIVTEQSYLQGIGTIWKALDEPERFAPQAVAQYIESLIPYGAAISTVGQALDPSQRQVGRVGDVGLPQYLAESVESRIPRLREGLPEQLDQLGRPIPSEQTGVGALNPLRTRSIQRSPELAALLQYGADVGEPPASFKGMPFTPAEQRAVNRATGPLIEKNVRQTMNEPNWQKWTEEDRRAALSKSVEAARRQAAGEIVDRLGTKEFEHRLAEEQKKKAPAGISGP